MNALTNIGVVVLAAGSSSRLGRPKQLVQIEGKPLLQLVVDEANACAFDLRLIVSGFSGEAIISSLDLKDFTPVQNPRWPNGIGSSIHAGTAGALDVYPELRHLMFLLSDQPFVNRAVIQRLIEAHSQNNKGITASQYGSDFGVPAIFSRSYFAKLLTLKDDVGAKKIIKNSMEDVLLVDFPNGALDIDTPADVEKLEQLMKSMK